MARGSKEVEESLKFDGLKGHIRDRIVIHQNPKIPKEGIFLGLNGIQFQIKPGVEIDIPRPVRQMLDTMIETETIQLEDNKTETRDIPRYTYTVIKEGVNLGEDGKLLDGTPVAVPTA
jgi:hypothetical protein